MSWSFFFDLCGKVIEKISNRQIPTKKLFLSPRFYPERHAAFKSSVTGKFTEKRAYTARDSECHHSYVHEPHYCLEAVDRS